MGVIKREPITGQRLSQLRSLPAGATVGASVLHEVIDEVNALRREIKAIGDDRPKLATEVEYWKSRFGEAERLTRAFARASKAGRSPILDEVDE